MGALARGVLPRAPWPRITCEPVRNSAPESDVELAMRRSDPRPNVLRIDVDAPDHVLGCRIQHRVRKSLALAEMAGVHFEIGEIA